MNVVVFASRKGGSGKTTLSAHLAAHASKRDSVLIDADPQGSLSLWHGLRETSGLSLRRAARGIAEAVKAAEQAGYNWAFVDTAPNKSNSVAAAIQIATMVVVPTRPSLFDLAAVEDTISLCRDFATPYAVVINSAPPKRNGVEAPIVSDARQSLVESGVPVWSGQITQRADFALATGMGAGVKEFDASSSAAAEIGKLWTAIERSVRAINKAHDDARGGRRAAA